MHAPTGAQAGIVEVRTAVKSKDAVDVSGEAKNGASRHLPRQAATDSLGTQIVATQP